MKLELAAKRERRVRRVRHTIAGTAARPRLVVARSNRHIAVQLIDDVKGVTLVAASDGRITGKKTKSAKAAEVGKLLASKAMKKGIKQVVFDRRHFRYHGRVAALAESARKAGLEF